MLPAENNDNSEENQNTQESSEDVEQLSREFDENESEHDICIYWIKQSQVLYYYFAVCGAQIWGASRIQAST